MGKSPVRQQVGGWAIPERKYDVGVGYALGNGPQYQSPLPDISSYEYFSNTTAQHDMRECIHNNLSETNDRLTGAPGLEFSSNVYNKDVYIYHYDLSYHPDMYTRPRIAVCLGELQSFSCLPYRFH